MAILNHEQINIGLLIANNIKYMAKASQKTCGHLCIINELFMLPKVNAQPVDVMIRPMQPINKSTVRIIPINITQGEAYHEDLE